MNICLNCEKETLNPKFCSKSCSATYNNKAHPKRLMDGQCICGKKISKNRTYCEECFTLYRRTKHAKKDQYSHVKSIRIRNKLRAVALLGSKCSICGYDKTYRALEFHHINPKEKSFAVSANLNKAWKLIETELDKCVLLCANCHREVEAGITKLMV
jgi:5-methylcytosine-specific restriction endonuclease McrA